MQELKPCPFCGGEAERIKCEGHSDNDKIYGHSVHCKKIGCFAYYQDSVYWTEKEAIAAWNTRAERTCKNVSGYGRNVPGERDWNTDGFDFECSVCNHCLDPNEFGESPLRNEVAGDHLKISYCPNCGAKVVD